MVEAILSVNAPVGLHARPAALFVQAAKKFSAEISVRNLNGGERVSNAKSILSVLTLGVKQGHQIQVQAKGDDEDAAIAALKELVESNFGEG